MGKSRGGVSAQHQEMQRVSPHVRDAATLSPRQHRPPSDFREDPTLKGDNVHKEGLKLLCAEKGRGAANRSPFGHVNTDFSFSPSDDLDQVRSCNGPGSVSLTKE